MNGTIIFPCINTAKILHKQENFRVHTFDQSLAEVFKSPC